MKPKPLRIIKTRPYANKVKNGEIKSKLMKSKPILMKIQIYIVRDY